MHPGSCPNGSSDWKQGIFDFSLMGGGTAALILRETDPAGRVSDIKISAPTLIEPSFGRLLKETGVQDIWVECHPQLFRGKPFTFLQR